MDSIEFLKYFAIDPETKAIGAYLEGIKDGGSFLQIVKEITKEKPIVIWRGGRTPVGAKAAFSHTGSLAGSEFVWKTVLKQAGAIEVESLEELVDTLLAFQQIPRLEGRGVAIISGLVDGGGGGSVLGADICLSFGLDIPPFSNRTRNGLEALLGRVGSILPNPLDVSHAGSNVDTIRQAIELASSEPHIHLIIIQESMDMLLSFLPGERVEKIIELFLELGESLNKPLVIVLEPGLADDRRLAVVRKLSEANIPVFPTLERAARAIANARRYFDYRNTNP